MTLNVCKGIGIGLLLASAVTLITKPAPTIEVFAPSVNSESIVFQDIEYGRFNPLPNFLIKSRHDATVVHHAVRRVEMPDGESGVRLVMWVKTAQKKPEWI